MTPAETTIVLVLAIGAIALIMRGFSRDERVAPTAGPVDPIDELLAEVSGADPETAGDVVAVTSDGWAFVPDGHAVALIPHRNPLHGDPLQRQGEAHPEDEQRGPSRLSAGDLSGARAMRGAPWRVEAVGRDGDFREWPFETEEAARAALALLERRIVRIPVDEDGEPAPLGVPDFEEARRLQEETEHALDHEDPLDPMV